MPSGNELLTPLTWQPVPGAGGAQCYPIIRKIDTISSNSYLLRTPDALLLIDPGGLAEQADHLASVIEECRKEHDLPLVVFLTHAHVDHFLDGRLDVSRRLLGYDQVGQAPRRGRVETSPLR